MQDVSTWGECWTESMWSEFRQWRDTHSEEDIQKVDMPSEIKVGFKLGQNTIMPML